MASSASSIPPFPEPALPFACGRFALCLVREFTHINDVWFITHIRGRQRGGADLSGNSREGREGHLRRLVSRPSRLCGGRTLDRGDDQARTERTRARDLP